MEKTIKCKYCGYACPFNIIKKHLEICDENPKGKGYIPQLGFFGKFELSPIASSIWVISVILAVTLGGTLWYLLAFLSLMWIVFKKVDYEAGVEIK